MTFQQCLELYPKWALITAAVLFFIHLVMPYHPREKYPRDNPPPRFFATFSLGELAQYIIQVLTFPLILFAAAFIDLNFEIPDELDAIILLVLIVVWWFIPRNLARRIDRW